MKTTTNKKTNEVFEVVNVLEGGRVQLINVETKEEKEVAESTFKRWYTKPQEVEVQTEEIDIKEVVEEEVVKEETTQEEQTAFNVDECNDITDDNTPEQMRAYLEDTLSVESFEEVGMTDLVECKDNIVAYKFKNKTIAQIKGKKKVKVYFTGKFLTEETFAKCSHTKPEYTHNAYVVLDSVQAMELVFQAIQESKQYLLNK